MKIDKEILVPLEESRRLKVEPIWINQIDDIEGPLYVKYIETHPDYQHIYVRPTISEMLQKAVKELPTRYNLIVRAGHRPIEVQYALLEGVKISYLAKNPQASDEHALEYARTFVSDPSVKLPPHCCGAAVDIDLFDNETRALVDFGCPVNTDSEISFIDTDRITVKQQANRDILHKVMYSVGFAPFQSEWWHFSYGDQVWADYYKQSSPLYGIVEFKF